MPRLLSCFLAVWLASGLLSATDSLRVEFVPLLNGEPVRLGADAGANISITSLRCYLSNVRLSGEGTPDLSEPDSYHLLEATDPASLSITLPLFGSNSGSRYDSLEFLMGIDSSTSAAGVFGGDLDPTRGMYWTWRSGYINFKLEGTSPLCATRGNRFTYHVGGYLPGQETARTIRLPLPAGDTVRIGMELAPLLTPEQLVETPTVMQPGPTAIILADRIKEIFIPIP